MSTNSVLPAEKAISLSARRETLRPAARARRRAEEMVAGLFMAPAAVLFLVFVVAPALAGLGLGLFKWDLFSTPQWVGLTNYARLFTDLDMWQSLGVTGLFVVGGVIPSVAVGFLLAVLINVNFRGIGAARTLYYMPMIVSAAISAIIWSTIFDPQRGLANQTLAVFGITGPNWLSDPTWARPALIMVMIWTALPLVVIIYQSGLQRIPDDVYAAAAIDGAGSWRKLWSITWPMVYGTTLLVVVLQFVAFVGGSFELALLMTQGGPLGTTQSLALYAYNQAFTYRDIGYASALSALQLVVIAAIVAVGFGARRLVVRKTA
jgi:multiple sugar transport system permease protein